MLTPAWYRPGVGPSLPLDHGGGFLSHTIEEIARAFSSRDFEAAFPYLVADVTWEIVGGEHLTGAEEIRGACERSAANLSGVTTEFRRFRTVAGDDFVVTDTLADYTDPEGNKSTVASCDIYDFDTGRISAIVSYNIELTG